MTTEVFEFNLPAATALTSNDAIRVLKYNGGTGVQESEKITPANAVQSLLDAISTTQGTVLYYNGTDWVALAAGTAGQFLKTQGAAANPVWSFTPTPAQGVLINGKIAPSVASNNLTVALKTMGGNNPSASDPVYASIGGVLHTITAALSVTINAGANSFNAGGAVLATKEVDYFSYLSYRAASSAVVIGCSRIPYANLYSDFSATATDERYGVFSTAPDAGDEICVVGRYAATLSAGAGYTWTVPTFTAANLIQRPVYETRWLDAAYVGINITAGDGTLTVYKYKFMNDRMKFYNKFTLGSTSSVGASNGSFTLPMSANSSVPLGGVTFSVGLCRLDDTGTAAYQGLLDIRTALNQCCYIAQGASGSYVSPAAVSTSVPHTWASTDVLSASGEVPI